MKYPALDSKIEATYAARSTGQNKNSLYDSYIRAIRWATDRIKDEGVVCFVSNGGYIDGNSADGLRKTLVDEYDAIYCYNLRGNQRTAGELSRKEGGKIFGSGSRSTVAVLVLVKGGGARADAASNGGCVLHYRDIGDYLDRAEKLDILRGQNLNDVDWRQVTPSVEGDWINHRDERFGSFQEIGSKTAAESGIFTLYSSGLKTGRDVWAYNSEAGAVSANIARSISFFQEQAAAWQRHASSGANAVNVDDFVDNDPTKISWNRADKARVRNGTPPTYDSKRIFTGTYRPFFRQHVYFDAAFNDMVYQVGRIFPTPDHENFGIYNVGNGSVVPFSALMTNAVPDLHVTGAGSGGQFFPRYTYVEIRPAASNDAQPSLFDDDVAPETATEPAYRRVDNITDTTLKAYRQAYGVEVTKDDVFYYVYGLLHSLRYREQFASDLRKSLPRIPMVIDFHSFVAAGRTLAHLHLHYESVDPYPLEEKVTGTASSAPEQLYRVEKMRFASKDDKSVIRLNSAVTLSGIPDEAYRYQLGPRSAIEWLMDRYQVKVDKASGIVNDPNGWSEDPRYIVDLLARIVSVSLATMKIVDGLPELDVLG